MLDFIFDAVGTFLEGIGRVVWTIIEGVISFARNIVGYFKGLALRKNRDIPFIADANKPQFRVMLQNAPTCNCGIFEGTYNEETDEIENTQFITSDQVDAKTRSVLSDEEGGLVVLS